MKRKLRYVIKIIKGEDKMEFTKQHLYIYNPSVLRRFIYRTADIIVGLIGCLLTIILFIIIKIAYLKEHDRYPVLFTQERIGLNGKLFKMYKFRSMIPNADEVLFELMESNEEIRNEYNKNKKLHNDPRITKIGQKIRGSSLDEFPQFFNVLKGDMTLVGPRPYLPREIEDMGDTYDIIIQCKPAITGPWQVGGRSEIDFKDRCQIDVKYISNKTIKEDIKIFIKTMTSVIRKNGAK